MSMDAITQGYCTGCRLMQLLGDNTGTVANQQLLMCCCAYHVCYTRVWMCMCVCLCMCVQQVLLLLLAAADLKHGRQHAVARVHNRHQRRQQNNSSCH